jgi:hypothetical protein
MPLQIPDQSIASQIQTPDMLGTMAKITALQTARQQLQSSQLDYQRNQQTFNNSNSIRDLAQNDPTVRNADGGLDYDKFKEKAFQIDPTLGSTASQSGFANQKASTDLHASQFKLSDDLAQKADQVATGLTTSPNITGATNADKMKDPAYFARISNGQLQDLSDAEDTMVAHGVPKLVAKSRLAPLYQMATSDPAQLSAYMINRRNQQLNAGGQVSAAQPNYTDNGQQLVNTNPMAPGAPEVQKQLPPTTPAYDPINNAPGYLGPQPRQQPQQPQAQGGAPADAGPQGLDIRNLSAMQLQFLMKQNPAAFAKGVQHFQQTSNQPVQQAAPQQAGMPAQPDAQQPGMPVQQPGARSPVLSGAPLDTSELMMTRAAANQAAASVGDSRSNNSQIKEILKNTSKDFLDPTGKGASYIEGLASRMGFAVGGDAASNYNSIAHNLALQQQTRNQQMGVKTDAGSAISAVSTGSPEQDRKTLARAVNISEAGNTGIEMFNQGMEAAIKKGGLPAVRDFKNAWSQNYDVNALRLANAYAAKDDQEKADVTKLLGGVDSPAFNRAERLAKNLELLQSGQIPRGGN